jgi:hypothetical protein
VPVQYWFPVAGVDQPFPPPPVETALIVNDGSVSTVLTLLAASVMVIVQLIYVHAASVLSVMVLFPTVAVVVELVQEPPYMIVPASSVVKV